MRVNPIKLFLLFLLFSCSSPPNQDESTVQKESPKKGFNWIVLQFTEDDTEEIQSILPFYTYELNLKNKAEDFKLWPFLSGYKRQKDRFYWFSFPLLTQSLSIDEPQKKLQHFISIPLITRYENYSLQDQFAFQRFDSLPLMTSFFSQTRPEKREKFFTLGTPFFQSWSLEQRSTQTQLKSWSIAPTLIAEENDVFLARRQVWDEEEQFSFLELANLSLLRYEKYRGRYPGSKYFFSPSQYMSFSSEESLLHFSENEEETAEFHTRWSLLNPMFSLEWEADQFRQLDFLPLFRFQNEAEHWKLHLTPLMLSVGSEHLIEWSPLSSLETAFPLASFDQARQQWNVLGPLFTYRKDITREETRVRLRGVFHYHQNIKQTNIDIGEGLLFNYHSDLNYERWSLISGLLFGRSIEPTGRYIEIFFFKIKTSDY